MQVNQAYKSPAGLIVATIELTQGYVTRIDAADQVFTDGHSWCVARRQNTVYASTNIDGKPVLMHSLLAPEWEIVDHADGNGLNNRRYNLRNGTGFRNRANSGLRSNNTSGYKGVTRHTPGKWSARIQVNRKSIYLGYFNSPKAAADAYDEAAVHYFGEWALTNAILAQAVSEGTDAWQYALLPAPPPEPVTHCKNGHEFTEENTYTYRSGKRGCRKCGNDRKRRAREASPGGCPPGCTCGRHRRAK